MHNCCMIQLPGRKQPRPIIAAILALVILGTLVLLSAEFFYGVEMGRNKPYSSGILAPVNHTIDWLAENAVSVNRAKKVSASTLRSGVLRALMLFKVHSATEYLTLFPVHTANSDSFPHIKNAIPLKLRI